MIDILYRESIADLLKLEVCEHFGNDFEATVRDILSCYNQKNMVVMVYLTSKPWRTYKDGHGLLLRFGKPEIRLALHNRHQMMLTLFHELEHLRRPPMINLSEKQHKREEYLVERRAKSAYLEYLARQSAFQKENDASL